jgi:hypothetical protein
MTQLEKATRNVTEMIETKQAQLAITEQMPNLASTTRTLVNQIEYLEYVLFLFELEGEKYPKLPYFVQQLVLNYC